MTNWTEPGPIYRYRANAAIAAGGPPHSVFGPAPCRACGTFLWYAYSKTRASWDGPTIRGVLTMRERGGAIHRCKA